jgi:hypothetical protein
MAAKAKAKTTSRKIKDLPAKGKAGSVKGGQIKINRA